MNQLATVVTACMTLVAGAAFAADDMKKPDAMMKKDSMTMQECKDHVAMAKQDGMKRDDAMMKKDVVCADMMKKDDAMMKKVEPMQK